MPDALPLEMHAAVSLGVLLLASLIGGILADLVRIPKVTAYLLAGVIVGPSVLHAISTEHIHQLEPLTKLAMALVLFELGCEFPLAHLRPILRRGTWLSFGELSATFLCVTLATWAFGFGLSGAVLLGALALATAPATTVLVLKESRSEGPITELAGVLVALNNIVAIIAFELLFLLARLLSKDYASDPLGQVVQIARDLGGACLLGALGGLLISYGSGLLSRRRWLVMVLAVSILMLGLCESWHLPYMLAFLLAGVVVVNTSDSAKDLLFEQEKIAGLLVVVFFAVHGAELQLSAFVAAGWLGVVYIIARTSGKIFGIRWASRMRTEAATVRRYLGSCMLAQAGAALALASVAATRWPELGTQIQVVILGSVVFFEIIGPMSIRWSVLKSGEVPLAQAISHRTETAASQATKMWMRAREALGWKAKPQIALSEMKVKDLLRRNVQGLAQTADFEQVVNHIRRSHDNSYVVTDADHCIVGIIRYELLSDTFFDSSMDTLVRAEDLASPVDAVVRLDEPLSAAVDAFRSTPDDVLPVVHHDQPHQFVGIIRRGDLTEFAIRYRT